MLRAKDSDKLAAAGTEGLHTELLRVELGDRVEAGGDGVVRYGLDLANRVRVVVLRSAGSVTAQCWNQVTTYVKYFVRSERLEKVVIPGRRGGNDLVAGSVSELDGEHTHRAWDGRL